MKNYLITGAAGFIGAAVARKLVSLGHYVVTIDNLTTGKESNIPDGVFFVKGDCGDPGVFSKIPNKDFDAIIHIAGQSSGEISFDDPVYDIKTNTVSTLLLLDFAIQNNCDRFIYAGTMSVYGIQPDNQVKEEARCNPTSFYGVGKLASECYMEIYRAYGIKTTSLRLFNVYGPGQNMDNLRQGMVSIYLAQLHNHGFIEVKGSLDRYRDFVYIEDVVESFLRCLTIRDSENKIINIGTGIKTTVRELVTLLFELYEKPLDIRQSRPTAGDLHGIYADVRKMQATLKIIDPLSLSSGLEKMTQWIEEKK